jgi:hypothetical protein
MAAREGDPEHVVEFGNGDGAVFWVHYSHADNTGSTSTTPPPVTTKIFAMAAR